MCEYVHVNSGGGEHVHMCVCVLNREVSTREGIDSSSNSLYMVVEVEIHIFVGFFYPSSQMRFLSNIHEQNRGGAYITVKCLEEESWRNATHFTDLSSVKDYTVWTTSGHT